MVGIAFGVILLTWQALSTSTITYDDGISYLAATGHQGLYWTERPDAQWVLAGQWQSFWTPAEFGSFKKISHDLALYDIHPPLYFWALHVWTHVVGVQLSAGPLLNIIFLVLAALFIYLTAIELRCTPWSATTASLLWLLSGSTLSADTVVRQYSLLGLAVAFYFFSLIRFLNARQLVSTKLSILSSFYIFLAIIIGLLTHYQFIVVLGCASLLAAFILIKAKDYAGFVKLSMISFSSLIVSIMLHPNFYHSFIRQQSQAQDFDWGSLSWRLEKIFTTLVQIFAPSYGYGFTLFVVITTLLSVIVCVRLTLFLRQKTNRDLFYQLPHEHWLPLASACLISFIVFTLYAFSFTPAHAMSTIYINVLTPVYFIFIAQLLNFWQLKFKLFTPFFFACLLGWQAAYGIYVAYLYSINEAKKHKVIEMLQTNTPIILDSVARGVLPTFIWHVNNDAQVYAASQEDILNNFPSIDVSNKKSILYISDSRDGNNAKNRETIINYLSKKGYQIKYKINVYDYSSLQLLEK